MEYTIQQPINVQNIEFESLKNNNESNLNMTNQSRVNMYKNITQATPKINTAFG